MARVGLRARQHRQLLLCTTLLGSTALHCQTEKVPLDTHLLGASDAPSPVLSSIEAGPHRPHEPMKNPFAGNTHALEQGERLYNWFNCADCHGAIGGGSMGPPLADADWIYGGEPQQILDSVLRGRPNGMPAFGGALSRDTAWQLVVHVESLGPTGGGKIMSSAAVTPDATGDPEKGVGERGTP